MPVSFDFTWNQAKTFVNARIIYTAIRTIVMTILARRTWLPQEKMKGERVNPSYTDLIQKITPHKLLLDHTRTRKSQEGVGIANNVTWILLSWAARTCILQEKIHASRVAALSAEELGTMSENNLRGITLEIRPISGIYSLKSGLR